MAADLFEETTSGCRGCEHASSPVLLIGVAADCSRLDRLRDEAARLGRVDPEAFRDHADGDDPIMGSRRDGIDDADDVRIGAQRRPGSECSARLAAANTNHRPLDSLDRRLE